LDNQQKPEDLDTGAPDPQFSLGLLFKMDIALGWGLGFHARGLYNWITNKNLRI
jgi:hypothetical protein